MSFIQIENMMSYLMEILFVGAMGFVYASRQSFVGIKLVGGLNRENGFASNF